MVNNKILTKFPTLFDHNIGIDSPEKLIKGFKY